MTDFASLNIKIDSSDVPEGARQLDRLTAAGAKAENSIESLGASAAQTGAQIKGAGRAASDYAASAQMAGANAGKMGEASGLARHHVQNLAFQFQDLGVQMYAAAGSGNVLKGVMTAFVQQGSQIGGIMSQAGIGVGGLAKQIGVMTLNFAKAHPALVAVGVAVGIASGAFQLFQAQIDKSGELKKFAAGLGLTKKEMEDLGPIGITATDAIKGLWKTIKEGLNLGLIFSSIGSFAVNAFEMMLRAGKIGAAGIYAAFVGTYKGIASTWSSLPGIIAEAAIGAANAAIAGVEGLINMSIRALNVLSNAVNSTVGEWLDFHLGSVSEVSLGRISNSYAGAGKKAGGAFVNGYSSAFSEAMGGMDRFGNILSDNIVGAAKNRLQSKADGLIDDRTAKSAGGKAGKKAGTAFVDKFLEEVAKFQSDTLNGAIEYMLGSVGVRENERANEVLDVQDQIVKAQKERTQGAIDEAEAMARLNDQLKDTVNRLDQLGGIGSTLGNIGAFGLGIKTGDYSGVRGPVGYAAQSLLTTTDKEGNRSLNEYGRRLETMFTKIFGDNGKFTKLLENAGTGAAIGGLVFGQSNKGAQTGSTIGGAFGASIFKELAPKLFKSLGDFAGPLGTLAGSLLGGVIGGLFNKAKTGSASVTNGNVTGGGNNADAKSATSGIAGAVSGSLSNIANQLGGTVGSYGYAVGMRNDYYRVSGTAGADTTSKNAGNLLYDGKDPAEAARIALLNAIQDGAIKGIREGAQRLLQAGADLNAQVAKALKFQGVFDDLKKSTDPLGFALDTLTKKFDDLHTIFTEAGASAADYASLEQLLAVQRTEALDQARRDAVDKVRGPYELQVRILELLGNKEDALAASRILEIAGLKGTLQPLQAMIYQLEDARKVIDTFTPLADSLKAFRGDLLGNQSAGGLGYVTDKFRAAAMGAANGDATSMGSLQGTATAFLEATKQSAETELDYRRAVGEVLASVDKGIFAAETQIDYAQAQIDAIKNSANILAAMRAEMAILQKQIVDNTGLTARLFTRFDADGLTVKTATDTPISVKVVT